MALEPPPEAYEPEWRYMFEVSDPAGPHVVLSGNVDVARMLQGNPDEEFWNEDEFYLTVGPYWGSVTHVVPFVVLNGYFNENADEDDEQGWAVNNLRWDAVSGTGVYDEEERIRLKFNLGLKGENTYSFYIGYQVFARGREIGHDGLGTPGPVWPLAGGA